METTTLNIKTDKEVKEQADIIFSELGLDMTTAINVFLRTVIRENRIPFSLTLDTPNDLTRSTITEGRMIARNKEVEGYSNIKNLKDALEV